MLKVFKVELKPTEIQKVKMHKTFGVCRFVYNLYLNECAKAYNEDGSFISGYSFSKWLNNEFIPKNPSYSWIKEVGSKAVKKSIMNAERAYKNFFKKTSKFPKFKNRNSRKSFYFPKNNKADISVCRHKINIPTLGFVRLKEFGYVPEGFDAKSVTVSQIADKYYVSVICEVEENDTIRKPNNEGIGIDLGIKYTAIVSNGRVFKNVNKTSKIKKIEKKLKREQRAFSRKLQNKKRNKQKFDTANIRKNKMRIAKIHARLSRIRKEYIRYVVNSLVKANSLPAFVSIEDLNVSGMLKNKHLSNAIRKQLFYYFKQYLIQKCKKHCVEVRVISRWYPSSKMCHNCGSIKTNQKLSDRKYVCDCGYVEDRDANASLNIRDCMDYEIAS